MVQTSPICGALIVLVWLTAAPALAAEPLEPDRPELTESAKLVPRGSVQLETGVALSKERRAGQPTERTLELEADLRIGIARHFEVNLSGEPFVWVRDPHDHTGVGDIAVGFRYRFVEGFEDYAWPPHLGVKAVAKLPIADEPIGTGRPDFTLLLLASFDLPWEFELEVNLGAAAIGQTRPNGYLGQALGSASVTHDLIEAVYGFAEILLSSREERDGRGSVAINVGLVYRVAQRLALDAGLQMSLVGDGPDYVFRTGLTARFGR